MPSLQVVCVNVHDMDAARSFYVNTLGLQIADESAFPQYLVLGGSDVTLLIEKVTEPGTAADFYPERAQIIINLDVHDVAAGHARLIALGVRVLHEALVQSPVGPYFAVADPSGNVIESIQFTHQ